MSAGPRLLQSFLQALGVELPINRRPQLRRFFIGLKPLRSEAYAGLLRAIARALIDARLVPVRKDARHDPVELIAAALEVNIDRWDRMLIADHASAAFWDDLAVRAAAFEVLFGVRMHSQRWIAAMAAAGVIEGEWAGLLRRARSAVAALTESNALHVEAILSEIVVAGPCTALVACMPRALPLARGITILRAGRVVEALAVFETIIDRVPGHTLALQQAARCHATRGECALAQAYVRRASRRGPCRALTSSR